MKKIFFNFILLGTLLMSTLISAQVVLTALEAHNGFTSTQTRSYSQSFTKKDCPEYYAGSSVTYTQSATSTATSTISQADADSKAAEEALNEARRLVREGGDAYANEHGTCVKLGEYRCLGRSEEMHELRNFITEQAPPPPRPRYDRCLKDPWGKIMPIGGSYVSYQDRDISNISHWSPPKATRCIEGNVIYLINHYTRNVIDCNKVQ